MKSVQQPKLAQRQRGMSTLSLLIGIALLGFVITCSLKMIPAYIDYWTLKGIFEEVEADPSIKQATPKQIVSMLDRRLTVNNIRNFDQSEHVSIRQEEGEVFIEFYYEVRESLFANVDVVMKFEHHFKTAAGT